MLNVRQLVKANNAVASYCALMPWFREVAPGVVLLMDGSLLAVFRYEGLLIGAAPEHEVDAALDAFEAAFNVLDSCCTVQTYLDKRRRQYGRESKIQNPVARVLDNAWMQFVDNGNLRAVSHSVCIRYNPFGGEQGFLDEVALRVSGSGASLGAAIWETLLERVSRKAPIERLRGKILSAITRFEDLVHSWHATVGSRVSITRLQDSELRAELSNRCNLATPREAVNLPGELHFLHTLLPTDTVFREANGLIRFEGGGRTRWVQVFSVKGYPGVADSSVMERLLGLQVDFTLAQSFSYLDREKAKELIMEAQTHYLSTIKGPLVQMMERASGQASNKINAGNQVLADESRDALIYAQTRNGHYGYHTMTAMVMADTPEELLQDTQVLSGVLINAGYGLIKETINSFSAFAGTIPGAVGTVTRSALINTENLAHMSVVSTLNAGRDFNPHLTKQRGIYSEALTLMPTLSDVPEHLNLHVDDVGHFMIVGPTGAGKSTIANKIIIDWTRYEPCRVITIDKTRSNWIPIMSLGGQYCDVSGQAGSARLAPARWLKDRRRLSTLRAWIVGAMHSENSVPFTETQHGVIDKSLAMAYDQVEGGTTPTLTLVHSLIQGQDRALAMRLRPYVGDGPYGSIFDNAICQLQLSDICGLDVGNVLKDERLAKPLLRYLFAVIDEQVEEGRPTLIYVEEGWYLNRDPEFAAGFEEWVRTMRSRGCVVGLSTQSLKELNEVPMSEVLKESIRTRIFLPNSDAFASADLYCNQFGLVEADLHMIREARRKRDFLLVQDGRKRLVDLHLPPEILAFTRNDTVARARFQEALDSGSPDWLNRYLERVNQHVQAP